MPTALAPAVPAAPLAQPTLLPLSELHGRQTVRRALSDLGRVGLILASLGAGARGLRGLTSLGYRSFGKRPAPFSAGGSTVDVLVPYHREEEKRGADENWFTSLLNSGLAPLQRAWQGKGLTTPATWPGFMPAMWLGGPAAAYGGYQLADKLLDAYRRADASRDLHKAEQEYEEALQPGSKLAQDLDLLYDRCRAAASAPPAAEKQADFSTEDWAGLLQGGALTGAGLLGLGSYNLAYEMAKRKRPSEILRMAKERREQRLGRTPPPVLARAYHSPEEELLAEGLPS